MSAICGASQAEIRSDQTQSVLMADMDMIRADRYLEDRRQVRANATLLLTKKIVTGVRTMWRGHVHLGSKDCSWSFASVFTRALENNQDEFAGYCADLYPFNFNANPKASFEMAKLLEQAAYEIAFESLDIGDIWVSVDHLMSWERDQ